jgi:2-(1,2-epoxy-1,2-dihydrophenyl)acetyl-CoA isomerase
LQRTIRSLQMSLIRLSTLIKTFLMASVVLEIKNSTGFITLNREEKLNSFNREMALLMQDKLDECSGDRSVRVVCITGAGKAFSAGQDLAEASDPKGPGLSKILSEQFNPIILKIRNLQKPVVAAVNGVAAGAGANIALCCDIVVAASSASFIQAFSKIGLIPDSGGTFMLPRLVGWQKASALMMLGEKINAVEAERIGMIYKVFPDDSFRQELMALLTTLSQMPTKGLALTKLALNRSMTNDLDQQLKYEDELQALAGASKDYHEGVNAFIEKRKPVFTGE